MRNRNLGFTLIEVMIAVAIVAILAAIALPSYSEYVTRARITEATSTLAGMQTKLDKHFQDNRTYAGACGPTGVAPLPSSTHFTYSCPTLDAGSFLVRAVGTGSMAGFTYTLDQANVRTTVAVPTSSGWLGTGAACWVIRKDGSC